MSRALLLLAFLAPLPAAASVLDGVSPSSVDAELPPGESVTITKTVTLPEDTPKLDLLLLVDLSGSYGDDLPNIKALADDLVADIRAAVPDSQFALATFVDFPFSPWGSAYSGDYAYSLDNDFTMDEAQWLASVEAMSVSYGADYPEAQYEGIFQAVTGQGREMPITLDGDYDDLGEIEPGLNASFRSDATKVIVITTDASFHETGDYGSSFSYPGADQTDTIDALLEAGVKVIGLSGGSTTLTELNELAAATGGASLLTTSTSSDIADAIIEGLATLTYTVSALPGEECDPLLFSYDPTSYTGVAGGESVVFDETITVPADITADALDDDGAIVCEVDFLADDTVIGTQFLTVTVPLNEPPVALCRYVELDADETCSAWGDVDDGSYDPDGDPITYDYSDPGPYPVGETEVTLTVTDPSGESASCVGVIAVFDTTPPEVVVGGGLELWPPNHKYVDLSLSDCDVSVYDSCGGELDIDTVGMLTSIYSDEPEDAAGNGDGKTLDDILVDGMASFSLRAERAGGENGRVYGISFDVRDGTGNITSATCEVGVPHSDNGEPAVDDGPGAGYTVY